MTTEMTPINALMDNADSPHRAALGADLAQDDQKTPLNLDELTGLIRKEFQAATQCAIDAVSHAVSVGRLLQLAKHALPHGVYVKWVAENFDFSVRRAQQYLRLAGSAALLEETKANRGSLLSIRQAFRVIADQQPAPQPKREERVAPIAQRRGIGAATRVVEQALLPLDVREHIAMGDESSLGAGSDGILDAAPNTSPLSWALGRRGSDVVDQGEAVFSEFSQPELVGESFASLYGEFYQLLCRLRSADWAGLDRQAAADCLQVLWSLLDTPEALEGHANAPELMTQEANIGAAQGKKPSPIPLPKRRRSGRGDPNRERFTLPSRMPANFIRPWESLKFTIGQARKTKWSELTRNDARHYVDSLLNLINCD